MNTNLSKRGKFIFFPVVAIAFFLAGGLTVMLLWNWILPDVCNGVGTLTYAKAVGLLILARLLFGMPAGRGRQQMRSSGYGSPWKEKWMNMSEREREEFKRNWKDRCERR